MGRYTFTIDALDRLVDDIERQRLALHTDQKRTAAGELAEARDQVKRVRDDLIATQHDLDRKVSS